jgi:hypothetical protein
MLIRGKTAARQAAAVVLLILAAMACRRIGLGGNLRVALGYLRSFLYIGLFAAWGVSVRRRVVQTQVRRYLTAIAALMVFWIAVRTAKYFLARDPDSARYLWHLYYLPMLFIPLLAVFAAFSLGRPEDFRLRRWTGLLYLPTTALLALVLTNDLHQLVFVFPAGAPGRSESQYGYGAGYWLVLGWMALCGMTALVVMLMKCRVPRSKTVLWLPIVPMLLAVLYTVAMVCRVRAVHFLMGDVTVSLCLFFLAFFECCIQCGLIQSNTHYAKLFRASTIHAQIVDRSYAVSYASDMPQAIPVERMREAERAPVLLTETSRLFSAAIPDGHVLWTQDISEEERLLRELQETNRELEGENALLLAENELKEKKIRVDAQNRLYDRITGEIEPQLNRLTELMEAARAGAGDTPRILAQIGVLGAYLKRRSNLIILSEDTAEMPAEELAYCLRESADNLEAAGAACSCSADCTGRMDTNTALQLYDLFEAVIEAALSSLCSALIRLTVNGKGASLRLMLSCACQAETITALPKYRELAGNGAACRVTGGDGELCVDVIFARGGDAR